MEAEQITWLRSVTGSAIRMPPELLPEPKPKPDGTPLTAGEKQAALQKASDQDFMREEMRRRLEQQQRDEEARKQFLLSGAQRIIDPLRPALKAAFDLGFESQTESTVLKRTKTKRRDFIDKSGDVSKSGDVHDMANAVLTKSNKRVEGKTKVDAVGPDGNLTDTDVRETDEVFSEALRCFDVLRNLRKEMENETVKRLELSDDGLSLVPGPDAKLFTRAEVISEVFDPLVRSKILPDAFIEDAYSRTQAMLDATNALYKADLADPSKFTGRGNAALAKGMVDMASGFAKCAMEATGHISSSDIRPSDILTGATELAKLSVDAVDTIDTARRRPIKNDDLFALLNQVPDLIGQVVGAATGNTDMQKVVTGAVTGGTLIVQAVAARDADKCTQLVGKLLSTYVDEVMAGIKMQRDDDYNAASDKYGSSDPGVAALKQQNTDASNQGALIKDAGTKLFSIAVSDGAPVIAKLLIQGKLPQARGQITRLFLDAAGQVAAITNDAELLEGKAKDSTDSLASNLGVGMDDEKYYSMNPKALSALENSSDPADVAKYRKIVAEQLLQSDADTDLQAASASNASSAIAAGGSALDALNPKAATSKAGVSPQQKRLDALRETYAKQEHADVLAQLEVERVEEMAAYKAAMRGGDKASAGQHTIESMIADLKRNQAIIATLVAVGSAGASLAAQFVSYAAIGTESIKLAANVKLAYEKARAWYDFVQEQEGARETASRYGPAIENFRRNAKFQFTSATINAAMNGMKLIVAAVAAGVPHAAPAVPAISAVSSGVSAVLGRIKAARLKTAWQETKKALDHPENRRLGQKARKLNPTLAKYTIAWGATEEKDPIAISMGLACGLTPEVLKNPSTNLAKVKAFMEAKFPDDGSAVGQWKDAPGWEKGLPEPQLSMKAVGRLYGVVGQAYGEVDAVPPSTLAGLLAAVEKEPPANATADVWSDRAELLQRLEVAFQDAGALAAKQADSARPRPAFTAFSDLASDAAIDAFMKVDELSKTVSARG